MERLDIMVDLETLGREPYNPMIQLGAVAFDIYTGAEISRLMFNIQVNKDLQVEEDTLSWWMKTNPQLLSELLALGDKSEMSEQTALLEFNDWIKKTAESKGVVDSKIYLWGNGMLFDNRIIRDKMKSYGIKYPIWYPNDRDMRTLVELYCIKHKKTYEGDLKKQFAGKYQAHDALGDCYTQIAMLTHCFAGIIGDSIADEYEYVGLTRVPKKKKTFTV